MLVFPIAHFKRAALSGAWDLNFASTVEATFDPAEEASPHAIDWNNDGTKFYVIGDTTDSVNQYPVSTPYDLNTIGAREAVFSYSAQGTLGRGFRWNNNGTKFYVSEQGSDIIIQYSVSTAYDVGSTVTLDGTVDIPGTSNNQGIAWRTTDGLKVYVCGTSSDTIRQLDVPTAFDVTSGTNPLTEDTNVAIRGLDIFWKTDGTRMYVVDNTNDSIEQRDASTPFDLTTLGSPPFAFDIQVDGGTAEGAPRGLTWKPDGTKVYVSGTNTGDIFQFPVG